MSSTSSYHSIPSTASTTSTTIRRKPLPTAPHIPRRKPPKSKHKWPIGRFLFSTLAPKELEPPTLELTNTAVGNEDDKWGDEYSESMDQRVLEPVFRNGWGAFELGLELGRVGGEMAKDGRLVRDLEGGVCVSTDLSEEVEEGDGGSDDTFATSVRRVHFAGDTLEAPMDRNSKRVVIRDPSAKLARSVPLQINTTRFPSASSMASSLRKSLASSDRLVEVHPEPMIEEYAVRIAIPQTRQSSGQSAHSTSQRQLNSTHRDSRRRRNEEARAENILKATTAAMSKVSDASSITLLPLRSVFIKRCPVSTDENSERNEEEDEDNGKGMEGDVGLLNALFPVFGMGVLAAVVAMVCGGLFGSGGRCHYH